MLYNKAITWFIASAVMAATSFGTVNAQLDSCIKQDACVYFTFEKVNKQCRSSSSQDYEVCMVIDTTKPSCAAYSNPTLALSSCAKVGGHEKCQSNRNGFNPNKGYSQNVTNIKDGYQECRIVNSGAEVEYLLSGGGNCASGMTEKRLINNPSGVISATDLTINCAPFRSSGTFQGCGGTNRADTADCYWKVKAPTSSVATRIPGFVDTRDIETVFTNKLKSAETQIQRTYDLLQNVTTEFNKVNVVPNTRAWFDVNNTFGNINKEINANCLSGVNSYKNSVINWQSLDQEPNWQSNIDRCHANSLNLLANAKKSADTFVQQKMEVDIAIANANRSITTISTYCEKIKTDGLQAVPNSWVSSWVTSSINNCASNLNNARNRLSNMIVRGTTKDFDYNSVLSDSRSLISEQDKAGVEVNKTISSLKNQKDATDIVTETEKIFNDTMSAYDRSKAQTTTRCGTNTACLSQVTQELNNAWYMLNTQARSILSNAKTNIISASVSGADSQRTLMKTKMNEAMKEINDARKIAGLASDSIDPAAAMGFMKEEITKLVTSSQATLLLIQQEAKIVNDAADNCKFPDYKDEALMFANAARKSSNNANDASLKLQEINKKSSIIQTDVDAALSLFDAVQKSLDSVKHANTELKELLRNADDTATRDASIAAQAAADKKRKKIEIDAAKNAAVTADARAKLIVKDADALAAVCTDDASMIQIRLVRDAAAQTAGYAKKANDLSLQGSMDDCKRAAVDANTAAASTLKAFTDAKKFCDMARTQKIDTRSGVKGMDDDVDLFKSKDCASYKEYELDFDDAPAGSYITDFFLDRYNVSISATGGYSPNNAARIFDTAKPVSNGDGDADLGSPNQKCGGPGHGVGGEPNAAYPNCVPQKNVLIIQESNKDVPDDNDSGGTITFTFNTPMNVDTIGLLDIDANDKLPEVNVYVAGSTTPISFKTTPTGDNGLLPLAIKTSAVTKLEVIYKGSGAVAYLRYNRCLAYRTDDLFVMPTTLNGGGSPASSPVAIKVASTSAPVATIDTRSGTVKKTVGKCMQDSYNTQGGAGNLICGMKNVFFTKIASKTRATCKVGEQITVDLLASLNLKASRYDIGWYVAVDGGQALTGQCVNSILEQDKAYNVMSAPGSSKKVGQVTWNNDALPKTVDKNDLCGDVFMSGGAGAIDITDLVVSQNVTCMDRNDDGNLDIGICITFRTALNDGKCDPTAPVPGDAQNCYCARYNIPQITVEKDDRFSTKC